MKLRMADGTNVPKARVILSAGTLWFYVDSPMTMAEVFGIMDDPEKTKRITMVNDDGSEETFLGYTELMCIRKEEYIRQINGGLKKAVD